MKNVAFLSLAFSVSVLFSSCFASFGGGNNHWQSACERNLTGEICFSNDTKREIKVNIGDTKTVIEAKSTICMDIYEGNYEYKAKQGFKKWESYIDVNRCEQEYVQFKR